MQEIEDARSIAWLNYSLSEEGKKHLRCLEKQISALLTEAGLHPPEGDIEQIAFDILVVDAGNRVNEKIFTAHLLQEGIPEAAILRLYPQPSPAAFPTSKLALDDPFLYQDIINTAFLGNAGKVVSFEPG